MIYTSSKKHHGKQINHKLRHDDSRLRAQQKQCVETSDARQRHRTLEQKKTNSSNPVGQETDSKVPSPTN